MDRGGSRRSTGPGLRGLVDLVQRRSRRRDCRLHRSVDSVRSGRPGRPSVIDSPGRSVPRSQREQRAAGPETGGLRRFSALDGIRALAVMAVLCYHAGISWMGGGLLGVDVFFVLSGFLITSLLCRELAGSGTVRLGRFWAQRARRLLPALFLLVLGVSAYAFAYRNSI